MYGESTGYHGPEYIVARQGLKPGREQQLLHLWH